MPMKPENYPANWKQISLAIREAAGNKCEFCGVTNKAIGARDKFGEWHDSESIENMSASQGDILFDEYPTYIRIVLTVAHHPDPDPMNCSPENLHALCQRCHNRLDNPMRVEHAKATRGKKKLEAVAATGQKTLWDD